MKVKRQKHVRHVLNFYRNSFQIQVPYNVMVDGTFCKAALIEQINISEQVPKYLSSDVKFCTTRCVLAECETFGAVLYGPLKILQQFQVHSCHHSPPKPAVECLLSVIRRNKQQFIIATQDSSLSETINGMAGVPLLYIAYKTVLLEAPSQRSKEVAENRNSIKGSMNSHQQESLRALRRQVLGEEATLEKKRKRKGPKGPNPLSCKRPKKAKATDNTASQKNDGKRRRKRKRKKMLNNECPRA